MRQLKPIDLVDFHMGPLMLDGTVIMAIMIRHHGEEPGRMMAVAL